MANVIIDISPNPTTLASGSKSTLTITYLADQDGSVELRTSAAFTIAPTNAALPASQNGVAAVDLVVTRVDPAGPKRCDILATFASSTIHTIIQVN